MSSKPSELYQIYNETEEEKPKVTEDAVIKGVMGVGTGLGESILVKTKAGKWEAIHTEGGYADLPPHDEEEFALLQYLQYFSMIYYYRKKHKSTCIPVERALSGPGLESIYDFLKSKDNTETASNNKVKVDSKEIVAKGLAGKDPIAVKALEMFAKVYGAEAGNFATRTLCYGGLYLVGSLTEGIKEYLKKSKNFLVIL